jgi:amino acid adenylation domain-containing protein
VGQDVPVGLCLRRSPQMVVAMLGVLKAGGAYLPLDPAFPADRLTFMLEDSKAPVLLTESALQGHIGNAGDHRPRLLRLDTDWDSIEKASETEGGARSRSSDDLAYLIYTSGSTGRPKGVEVPHRAVVNFLESTRREPGMSEYDVLLAVTTLSFDIAVLELYLPLVAGATTVIAEREVAADGRQLANCLKDCQATVMQATPATWRMLLDGGWSGMGGLKALCGGDSLGPDLVRQLLGRVNSLWNLYGPTEATIWSTVRRITSSAAPVTVGRPIANTRVYLLDAHRNPVPVGVPGELWIGGDGLARGYHNRPDLTSERFKPDPFDTEPGARIYATGDLARYRADGDIELLGRLDFQVKVRGFRIELGEIEHALSRVPGISQAVVVAPEDETGVKRLVAFLVADEQQTGGRPQDTQLRQRLGEHLPDYMIPAQYRYLERLPLTPNGKIDRLGLASPALTPGVSAMGTDYLAPRNPIEQAIAEAAAALLGQPRIGVNDDFFALGGHSLLGVRLLVELEKRFKVSLPLPTLFATPTVAGLAEAIQSGTQEHAFRSMMPVRAEGDRPAFFCVQGDPSSLAPHLHPRQPYYWLHHALNTPVVPYATVPEIAASHVSELRTLQPHGPYYLGGFSFGGVVAYEMAQQLRAAGEEVGLLALFDPTPPTQTRPTRAHKVVKHVDVLGNLGMADRARYLVRTARRAVTARVQFVRRRLKVLKNQVLFQYYRRSGEPLPASMLVTHRLRLFLKAARRYRFEPYEGDVTLFVPGGGKSREERVTTTQNRWKQLIRGRAEIHIIDSAYRHTDLFRLPFSKDMADQLNPYLPRGRSGH